MVGVTYPLKTLDVARPLVAHVAWPLMYVQTTKGLSAFSVKQQMDYAKAAKLLPAKGKFNAEVCNRVNQIAELKTLFGRWMVDSFGTEDASPSVQHGEHQIQFLKKTKKVTSPSCKCSGSAAKAVLVKNMVCAKAGKTTDCCVHKDLQMSKECKAACAAAFVPQLQQW